MKKKNSNFDDKWKVCSFCKYIKVCTVGQGRIKDLADNPVAVYDIGCFSYEIYLKQGARSKQLGFFQ